MRKINWAILGIFVMGIIAGCKGKYDKEFDGVPDEKPDVLTAFRPQSRDTLVESGARRVERISQMEGVSQAEDESPLITNPVEGNGLKRIAVRGIGSLRQVLNDSNAIQLEAARKIGIDPIEDIRGAYRTKRPIVKVTSCKEYQIDDLKHSLPYLVPEAAKLLKDIGRSFNDSLKSRGGNGYRIKVTSLLRTPQTVKSLRKINRNASDASTHQFATTFDISYTKFFKIGNDPEIHDGDLKNLLAEILNNKRQEGRCYVKFERHTSCFHITCR